MSGRILWWKGRDEAVNPYEVEGVDGDHRYPWKVCSQVSAYGLCWSSNFDPSGVTIPCVDRPGRQVLNGTGGGGIGKNISSKTARHVEHLREAEEYTGPRIQESGARYPETDGGGRKIH